MQTQFRTILLTLLAVYISCANITAQIIFHTSTYTVNFSNQYHEPLWVSYKLYHGGGECDRKTFHFINDNEQLQTATNKDYSKSGYDKGHLANAEDFAFDCTKDELTFRYYNCLPQTPNLNRGVWKTYETQIREWSQSDSLLIICGGVFSNKKIKNITVPDYCWKVVQSLTTKKILFCGWFTNTDSATEEDINYTELLKRTGYQLHLKQ
jgi:endonuclease G